MKQSTNIKRKKESMFSKRNKHKAQTCTKATAAKRHQGQGDKLNSASKPNYQQAQLCAKTEAAKETPSSSATN